MIRSEELYHEMITIELELNKLKESGLIVGEDYKMVKVDVPDWEYEKNMLWVEQKKKSVKEYKKLKKIEFDLRNNQINKK